MGSTAHKRTPIQIRRDRARATELALTGHTHAEIAEILYRETGIQLTDRQITYDLRKVRDEWKKERLDNTAALVRKELFRIDELERQLWKALRQSFEQSKEKVIVKIINDKDGTAEEKVRKITEVIKDGTPSAAIFAQIHNVQKERRRLLGLYTHDDGNAKATITLKGFAIVSPDNWPDPNDVVDGEYSETKQLEG